MLIETQRLIIRDINKVDEIPFVEMASDGSLNDVGFDKGCNKWMENWITEAKAFSIRNNPCMDYIAYTITLKDVNTVIGSVGCSYYEDLKEIGITYFIGTQYRNNGYAVEAVKAYTQYFFNHYDVKKVVATIREENIASWKVLEKVGFVMTEKKMYQDISDAKEEMYKFYEFTNNEIFLNQYTRFLSEFEKGKAMVLSTSENDKVTSRMMSIVQHDGVFYFQTDKTFRKYQQLINNPQIALCIGNIQIEGVCKEIRHPMNNASFCDIYKECFGSSFNKYTSLKNERLFLVKPTYVERWLYVEGVPFIETFDVENKEYKLTKCESM